MPLDPLAPKWESFGWKTYEIDGHDIQQIIATITDAKQAKQPVMIIANTVKGKGVSFMENAVGWHGGVPNLEATEKALKELKHGI